MRCGFIAIISIVLVSGIAVAQKRVKRAEAPKFGPAVAQGVFFDNVFEQGLQGPRPANLGQAPAVASGAAGNSGGGASAPSSSSGSDSGSSGGGGLYAWSKIISPTTVEDEVKALKAATDQNVTTPTKFAGGDYRAVRRDFTVLAMLFGIAAEYDGEVRWKDSAPAARDLFARTAANAKVGTQQVYNEAKACRDQLADLLNGSKIERENTEQKTNWSQAVGRSPLMQRLETAFDGKVQPGTSNPGAFKDAKAELKQNAEIIAAIAEVLKQEGMEDASDDDYIKHCEEMKAGALEIVGALANDNQDAAAKAAGRISQACSQCHESYRG